MSRLKISHPTAAFGLKPSIKNDDQLNEALHEIAYLEYVEAQKKADLDEEISRLRAEYQETLVVVVNAVKEPVPIADHVQKIREATEAYCEKNRSKLVDGDKKFRDFTHGTIGWKQQPAKIDLAEGYSASKVEKLLDSLGGGVLKKIRKLLDTVFFVKTRPLSLVAEPKLALSKTNAKKAYENDDLKDDHLEAIGLVYLEGDEKFYIKTNDTLLKSEAA